MPIEWSRIYASDLAVESVLGRGWVLPWKQSLRILDEFNDVKHYRPEIPSSNRGHKGELETDDHFGY